MTQDQDAPTKGTATPIPWDYAQSVARSQREPLDRRGAARVAMLTLASYALAGGLAAIAWSQLADPASFQVTRAGAFMDEIAAAEQFGVEVTYSWIAVALSAVVAIWLTVRHHRVGWLLAVALVVSAATAAVVQWKLGVALGPPEPDVVLAGAAPGDQVPDQLAVDAKGALLLWPITALVALLGYVGVHRDTASPDLGSG